MAHQRCNIAIRHHYSHHRSDDETYAQQTLLSACHEFIYHRLLGRMCRHRFSGTAVQSADSGAWLRNAALFFADCDSYHLSPRKTRRNDGRLLDGCHGILYGRANVCRIVDGQRGLAWSICLSIDYRGAFNRVRHCVHVQRNAPTTCVSPHRLGGFILCRLCLFYHRP